MFSKDDARVDIRIVGEEEGRKYGRCAASGLLLIDPEQLWHAYDHVQ